MLGYAYADRFRERSAYRWAVETTIYVADSAQRRGVGRLLYRALLDVLRRQGFTQAIAAIDNALYDVKAKRAGLSLAKLLGAQRDSVRCYNTSGGFLLCPADVCMVDKPTITISELKPPPEITGVAMPAPLSTRSVCRAWARESSTISTW